MSDEPSLRESESAWLIEWPQSAQLPPRWWHPGHGWVIDANAAVRFARREDAEALIKHDWRRMGGSHLTVTEHEWVTLSPAEEGVIADAVSEACDTFMRRIGQRYPWLHPDYDPDNALWHMRATQARRSLRARKDGSSQKKAQPDVD